MTQIVGKIVDSGGVPITGELIVTLDAPMIDTSTTPDQLYLSAAQTAQFKVRVSSDGTISNDNSGSNTYFTRCSGKRLFW
ncbi:MAG: hypothetical protein KME60_24170 [Cyanomargarita calcarea GSE-NOS-MK-12-04C]|jgi:hypothetical protein|uniref:Uncharacterized protein n=1 Tax=Cyanomargarita calcarea GSE-NOS-MK-12-04C TaxID=2839659 RepID=A0A951UX54_9CYAN|nr:hypothetical protein [Cyanomargarita calcarea GSE-NOS-MK-12-04C]